MSTFSVKQFKDYCEQKNKYEIVFASINNTNQSPAYSFNFTKVAVSNDGQLILTFNDKNNLGLSYNTNYIRFLVKEIKLISKRVWGEVFDITDSNMNTWRIIINKKN